MIIYSKLSSHYFILKADNKIINIRQLVRPRVPFGRVWIKFETLLAFLEYKLKSRETVSHHAIKPFLIRIIDDAI